MSRKPNSGPYIVKYRRHVGVESRQECHTWADACALMRSLLIDGCVSVGVEFA
jgi:hypothetical protein